MIYDHTTGYAIWENLLGGSRQITATEEQYNTIKLARNRLSHLRDVEEKFLLICESYSDFERYLFDVKISDMLFSISDLTSFNDSINSINRKILHFLTCTKLYLDTIESHYEKISQQKNAKLMKEIKSHTYDNSIDYFIMDNLRNYVQHAYLPINSTEFVSCWDKDRKKLLYNSQYKIELAQLDKS